MSTATTAKKVTFQVFDAADFLETEEDIAAYLEAWIEEAGDDPASIARALGTIARAKGMSQIARAAGLSRESLYKALSGERTPDFRTILKVVSALGLKLRFAPRAGQAPAGDAGRGGTAS